MQKYTVEEEKVVWLYPWLISEWSIPSGIPWSSPFRVQSKLGMMTQEGMWFLSFYLFDLFLLFLFQCDLDEKEQRQLTIHIQYVTYYWEYEQGELNLYSISLNTNLYKVLKHRINICCNPLSFLKQIQFSQIILFFKILMLSFVIFTIYIERQCIHYISLH